MGTNLAPILATVKMWTLERGTICSDFKITLPTYSIFFDDFNGPTSNSRSAQQPCTMLADWIQQDTYKLIKITLDYPLGRDQFTPFLLIPKWKLETKVKSSLVYSGSLKNPSHYTTILIALLAPKLLINDVSYVAEEKFSAVTCY